MALRAGSGGTHAAVFRERLERPHRLPPSPSMIMEDVVSRYLMAEVGSGHSYPGSQSSSLSCLFAFALEMHVGQHFVSFAVPGSTRTLSVEAGWVAPVHWA